MRITVVPGGALRGRLRIPGDKSIAHRMLIVAGLSPVPVYLSSLPDGEDVRRTRGAMAALGAWFEDRPDGRVRAEGVGAPGISEARGIVDCGNSGTSMRLLAGLTAGAPHLTVLAGDASLSTRPMRRVIDPLRAMGATVLGRGGDNLPPLAIRGGGLRGIEHRSAVASAQVKSCVLLAGLSAEGDVVVHEPSPSRDHTERMLADWGVELECEPGYVAMHGGQPLIPPAAEPELTVPGDLSSAAFVLVAASLRPGSDVVLENVGINPTRTGVLDVLQQMGARIRIESERRCSGEPVADLRVRGVERLRPFHIDGELLVRCVDEIPILSVAAALADGRSTVADAAELRRKESDRLAAVAGTLSALGVPVDERPVGLEIRGVPGLRGGRLSSHGDHRMAMAQAVAGGVALEPVTIDDAAAVAVSWPSFFEDMERLEAGVDGR